MENLLNELIDSYKEELISDTIRLIKKKSVNEGESLPGAPFGKDIAGCLDEALKLGEELGFQVQNYDGYAGIIQYGTEGKQIGILAHLDVVPAGEGWTYPPFDGTIVDGNLYGRGSIDDKGPLVACLYAMKAIKESGLPIRNHVRQIMGTDEEGGQSRCIKYYLTKEKQPWGGFSPDGSFPVIHAEKGIIRYKIQKKWDDLNSDIHFDTQLVSLSGGEKINMVPPKASAVLTSKQPELIQKELERFDKKDRITFRMQDGQIFLDATGVGAHSMQPWEGESAVNTLLQFLSVIEYGPIEVKDYIDKITKILADGYLGENMGIACEDKLSGPLSHSLGILRVDCFSGEASVDMRYPIHADREILIKTIKTTCKENNLIMEIYQDKPCLYVPVKDMLVQTLWSVYKEVAERKEPPVVIGGGTYCRTVENFLAYGPVFPGQKELAHQADEYIEIDNLILSAKIYAQAIYQLLNI